MIKQLDLTRINTVYQTELTNAFTRVLDSGMYILGDEVKSFEDSFSKYCETNYCIGTGNGYDALSLIIKSYIERGDLKIGDDVLVPANTFIASALAISNNGLVPVFMDIDPYTYNSTLDNIKDSLTHDTKAVMIVHLYGRIANDCCDIAEYCKDNSILLIEDAAQAIGATDKNGKKAGSFGDATAFSFYPGKNLGALGDAGAVVTNDIITYYSIKSLQNYGSNVKYCHDLFGVNSRLDELQAAMLSVKLKYIDDQNALRQQIAANLHGNNCHIQYPKINTFDVYHQFVVLVDNREHFVNYMQDKGIETGIHYPTPIHKQKVYSEFNDLVIPNAENHCNMCVSIPIDPFMELFDFIKIKDSLDEYSNH